MLMFGRMLTMVMAILGGLVFSQAPEFAQQYRQRIGGALGELKAIITRFDSEAGRNGLDREKALGLYSTSPQHFLQSQGDAMRYNFDRFNSLTEQNSELQQAQPMARPFIILRHPDPDLVANAWGSFSPGVPVTFAGIVWAGIGLVLGWLAAALFGTASLRAARRSRRRGWWRRRTAEEKVVVVQEVEPAAETLVEERIAREETGGRGYVLREPKDGVWRLRGVSETPVTTPVPAPLPHTEFQPVAAESGHAALPTPEAPRKAMVLDVPWKRNSGQIAPAPSSASPRRA